MQKGEGGKAWHTWMFHFSYKLQCMAYHKNALALQYLRWQKLCMEVLTVH